MRPSPACPVVLICLLRFVFVLCSSPVVFLMHVIYFVIVFCDTFSSFCLCPLPHLIHQTPSLGRWCMISCKYPCSAYSHSIQLWPNFIVIDKALLKSTLHFVSELVMSIMWNLLHWLLHAVLVLYLPCLNQPQTCFMISVSARDNYVFVYFVPIA